MFLRLLFVGVAVFMVDGVHGYSHGVPETACVNMLPAAIPGVVGPEGHLSSSQNLVPTYGNTKTPPYYMTSTSAQYTPGQTITVNIVANQTSGMVVYKGIMLQARKVLCAFNLGFPNQTILVEEAAIGKFESIPSNKLLKTFACNGIEDNTVCHRSPQYKINESAVWIAPEGSSGHVVFRATIIQEPDIYWTHVHSPIITDPRELSPTPKTCAACRTEMAYVYQLAIVMLAYSLTLMD